MKIRWSLSIVLFALAALGGCVNNTSSGVYTTDQAFNAQRVRFGRILSMRPVEITEKTNYTGTVAGALLGSNIGSSLFGSNSVSAHAIGSVLGAVAGGVAGNTLQKNITTQKGIEITVKLRCGAIIAVVQRDDQRFAIHQKVRVVSQTNGKTRVIPL